MIGLWVGIENKIKSDTQTRISKRTSRAVLLDTQIIKHMPDKNNYLI